MASPSWKARYAKSVRSCNTCKQPIDRLKFRLDKMVQATQFDGFKLMWNHADCILKKSNQIKSLDNVKGIESLKWEDQQKIRKYVEGGGHQNNPVPSIGESSSSVTDKVKGQSAVHESSGLQDCSHILEDGKSIYNTTFFESNPSTNFDRYHILQIIQEDEGTDCYVFHKWGQVGSDKIGRNNIERMSKSDAIQEFRRLYLKKTGNQWEHKEDFQKQPGRFFPPDIDYGVNKEFSKKENLNEEKSKLAPPLLELMKILFNVETYRTAMQDLEINISQMPVRQLSKKSIKRGFVALTEIQNLLNSNDHDPSIKESQIEAASKIFFTVIPSINPCVISDEEGLKSKVKMMEDLWDIEIGCKLLGFDHDNDDSFDEKYKRLCCDISPLPHDSEDYRLIEKYLETTHAPTDTSQNWSLKLEEAFLLEREGEFDKFAPYREKCTNRMLLWHGSQLATFVSILSQGLRIAPPEAPATGYMFGKGVYFSDLVNKSPKYCYLNLENPVGLMLLSEVALGEVYELKKAKYMDRPPEGKHSTKGLGQKVPSESQYLKGNDEVVVPCGKPVSSNVKSMLMYNKYIVYDTAQVKMQYLLKVRFHEETTSK